MVELIVDNVIKQHYASISCPIIKTTWIWGSPQILAVYRGVAAEPSKCKTQLNASPSRTQAPADRGLQEEAIELPLLGEPSRPWPGKGETVEPTGARYREDGVGNDRCNRLVARPVVEDREPEHGRLFSRGQLTEAPTGEERWTGEEWDVGSQVDPHAQGPQQAWNGHYS